MTFLWMSDPLLIETIELFTDFLFPSYPFYQGFVVYIS
jgi:hypothetical protein